MTDLNLQLVREFFELNLFHVLTNWQQDAWNRRGGDAASQLLVENPSPTVDADPEFVLTPARIGGIERAVVEVRAWHGDRFYPSVIESNPVLSRFVEGDAPTLARSVFADRPYDTILVVSELPATVEQRARAVGLLRAAGIGHVMEFPAILQDLLDKVSVNGDYAGSPTLQTLRLLKRYRFIRNQQMEFVFRADPPSPSSSADVEVEREADSASGDADEPYDEPKEESEWAR